MSVTGTSTRWVIGMGLCLSLIQDSDRCIAMGSGYPEKKQDAHKYLCWEKGRKNRTLINISAEKNGCHIFSPAEKNGCPIYFLLRSPAVFFCRWFPVLKIYPGDLCQLGQWSSPDFTYYAWLQGYRFRWENHRKFKTNYQALSVLWRYWTYPEVYQLY